MKRHTQAALTLALLLAAAPLARAAEPTEQVIRAIQRRDGTVVVDEKSPSRPIVELNLNCSPGVDDALLARLRGFTRLRVLRLAFTQVTDAGLEHLKGLEDLRALDLDYTQVTDKGIDALQTALPEVLISHKVFASPPERSAIAGPVPNVWAVSDRVTVPEPDATPIEEPELVAKYLHAAQLPEGEKALAEELRRNPTDDRTRFGLGVVQFLRAVEHLGQSFYRHGLRSNQGRELNVPLLRLPVPANPTPEKLTYPAFRRILQDWVADLSRAEETLAGVRDDDVKLPLRLGLIRLDFGGKDVPRTYLRVLVNQYVGGGRLPEGSALPVVFDRGDVAWLRGYCHLLMAMGEIALAHDGEELFDSCAHLFFANVETRQPLLTEGEALAPFPAPGGLQLLDFVALAHSVHLPVREPERLKTALGHLEQMIALGKESWRFILAETDDDHEWIPNPGQRGALGIRVSREMADSWLGFLDEAEAILAGKRLIPFWRGGERRGVNLRRVFTEPRTFDLVLWVQGTAATPYLEEGELTRPEVWDRLQRVFGGNFIGFALWFN
jgi:hypothetical protein